MAQEQLRGTFRHSPPHRQFLIHRCSHCVTAVVLLGDFSMVTQPHLGNQGWLTLTLPSQIPALLGEMLPSNPTLPKPGLTQGHSPGSPRAAYPPTPGSQTRLCGPGGMHRTLSMAAAPHLVQALHSSVG